MSIRGVCPPSTAIPSANEKALEEENATLREQNAAMVEALKMFVYLADNIERYGAMADEHDWRKVAHVRDVARHALARTESAEGGDR
jgi:hypothetical protein